MSCCRISQKIIFYQRKTSYLKSEFSFHCLKMKEAQEKPADIEWINLYIHLESILVPLP